MLKYTEEDWFSPNIPTWKKHLLPALNHRKGFLAMEIGSFEGRSTNWICENILKEGETLICVDPFKSNRELRTCRGILGRFKNNTRPNSKKIDLHIKTSAQFFQNCEKVLNGRGLDFVYIDGSHDAIDVLFDATNVWQLLRIGGCIVFDDYRWKYYSNPLLTPKPAIDAFLKLYKNKIVVLHKYYQVIVKRKR